MIPMKAKPNFTVRKQSSGYSASVKWYVFSLGYGDRGRGRVSVHANSSRRGAELEADDLNRLYGFPTKYTTEEGSR